MRGSVGVGRPARANPYNHQRAQFVANQAAGLQLTIVSCSRVAQPGSRERRFVVCDVTLTALRDGLAYSGQFLAITEFARVSQTADWWTPTVNVAGMIGYGSLSLNIW